MEAPQDRTAVVQNYVAKAAHRRRRMCRSTFYTWAK